MRVLVDARISPGRMGGVQQVVSGLAGGFSELSGSDEIDYLTLREDGWLRPYVGDRAITHARRSTRSPSLAVDALRRRLLARAASFGPSVIDRRPVPTGRAWAPTGRYDAVHFVTQQGFRIGIPSVYSPYDLLHLHHPEFFTPDEIARREQVYRFLAQQAHSVVVMTAWGRSDLVEHYDLPAEKVRVVPLGVSLAPTSEQQLPLLRAKYHLPARFALYPAHTWPHKNHLRLLRAVAALRDRGVVVPLVCTGQLDQHAAAIREAIAAHSLDGQVRLLGRVPDDEMPSMYKLASCVVFPSLFEGWGLPVFEAFASGVPVACSEIGALKEQASGAAAFFDPLDVDAMAGAIASVHEDPERGRLLVTAGRRRVRTLTWRRTARAYQALYREAGGETLSDLDRALVTASGLGDVEAVAIEGEPVSLPTAIEARASS